MNNIQFAKTEKDILKCGEAIICLRPHLKDGDLVKMITEMFDNGFKLAFIEENEKAVAIIGYRHLQFLFNGKHIYIDDLSTLPEARGKGYGSQLLQFVFDEAKAHGYATITLDSGFQRIDAHRLYLNQGFTISSLHFSKSF